MGLESVSGEDISRGEHYPIIRRKKGKRREKTSKKDEKKRGKKRKRKKRDIQIQMVTLWEAPSCWRFQELSTVVLSIFTLKLFTVLVPSFTNCNW